MQPYNPNISQPMPPQPYYWHARYSLISTPPRGTFTLPAWFTNQSFIVYLIAFAACSLIFGYAMDARYAAVSVLSTIVFFLGGASLFRNNRAANNRDFITRVFVAALILHFVWIGYCFFYFNMFQYGYISGAQGDVEWYIPYAQDIANWVRNGFTESLNDVRLRNDGAWDDTGYPIWLAIIYLVVGGWGDTGTVLIPLIIKGILAAYCAVFIYHTAQRHFGEDVARMAAIFVALYPNMAYWCGTMLKEPELVFLCCWFVDSMDGALSSNDKLTFKSILPASLIGLTFFLFRSALGLIAFAAVLAHIVLASQRIVSAGKKVIAGLMVAGVLAIGLGQSLFSQITDITEKIQSGYQQTNMEWRSTKKEGNTYAKYASATVFAPLIFTIPFPTFNMALKSQVLQAQLSGGSFIKNVISFFVILSLFILLFSGQWRNHVFIIAFMCGYMAALVFSEFAQSGRFHMPVIPLILMFGAYGISIVQRRPKLRSIWPMILVIEIAICLFWNWFKLAGRGMI